MKGEELPPIAREMCAVRCLELARERFPKGTRDSEVKMLIQKKMRGRIRIMDKGNENGECTRREPDIQSLYLSNRWAQREVRRRYSIWNRARVGGQYKGTL